MKKISAMRVAVILMALTLITSCFVGGTFAKYTSTATLKDDAVVAKWDITVGEGVGETQIALASPATVAIDLFTTINDTDTTDGNESMDGELDVAATKIAPGTTGSFDLKITNKSEVTAQYAIDFSVTNASNIPLEYSIDGTNWKTSIDDIDIAASESTVLAMNQQNATTIATVQWRWAFGDPTNNASDTALGIAAREGEAPSVTVSATLTVNQVD